jgi:aminopeptidase YwaD
MKRHFASLLTLISFFVFQSPLPAAQTQSTTPAKRKPQTRSARPVRKVCAACIRAHEEFLASDALRGRGSGTPDELVAATYIASELRQYGIEPAGDEGGYIQRATIVQRKLAGAPELRFMTPGDGIPAQQIVWTYGKDFAVFYLTRTQFSGPLRKMDAGKSDTKIEPGAVVLVTGKDKDKSAVRNAAFAVASTGAVAVLVPGPADHDHFEAAGRELPKLPPRLEGEAGGDLAGGFNALELSAEAVLKLEQMPDGTVMHFEPAAAAPEKSFTWNAVGMLRGSDPALQHAAVLFSAHLDHLGMGRPVKGDDIYNGADDDASGTTAVLELARVLGAGPRPRRTVIFALFGSEEAGGLGSTYFREHPPLPLKEIAANLEFEMIGRPDPALKADTVWLTGWERSNLGPVLAAHGAHVVGDPHPEQNFFARSDNYVLAKKGVVAQTISSYGLHGDYHQPSDDVAHLDFKHMTAAIGSLLKPVQWLVNSDFKPEWKEGEQP